MGVVLQVMQMVYPWDKVAMVLQIVQVICPHVGMVAHGMGMRA